MTFCGGQYFTDDVMVCYGQYFTTDTQYSGCDGQCCATHRKYIVVCSGQHFRGDEVVCRDIWLQ